MNHIDIFLDSDLSLNLQIAILNIFEKGTPLKKIEFLKNAIENIQNEINNLIIIETGEL